MTERGNSAGARSGVLGGVPTVVVSKESERSRFFFRRGERCPAPSDAVGEADIGEGTTDTVVVETAAVSAEVAGNGALAGDESKAAEAGDRDLFVRSFHSKRVSTGVPHIVHIHCAPARASGGIASVKVHRGHATATLICSKSALTLNGCAFSPTPPADVAHRGLAENCAACDAPALHISRSTSAQLTAGAAPTVLHPSCDSIRSGLQRHVAMVTRHDGLF
jgi:hypothetical protein